MMLAYQFRRILECAWRLGRINYPTETVSSPGKPPHLSKISDWKLKDWSLEPPHHNSSPTMLVRDCRLRSACICEKSNAATAVYSHAREGFEPSRISESSFSGNPGNGQVVDPAMRLTSRSVHSRPTITLRLLTQPVYRTSGTAQGEMYGESRTIAL